MATVAYPHIERNEAGVPLIMGTTIKVIEVVRDRLAYGWDADEIHRQHPHLSLAQIYSALAFYYDHKEELDRDMEERDRRVAEIKAQLDDPAFRAMIKARRPSP